MRSIKVLLLLAAASMLLTFHSCQKDNSDIPKLSNNTISAKVDGILTKFNNGAMGGKLTDDTDQIVMIQGAAANGTVLSIALIGTLTSGKTFSTTATDDDHKPLIIFTAADGTSFLNGDDSPANILTVTITSVSGERVKGTFNGRLSEVIIGDGDPETKLFTEGTFDVTLTTTKISQMPDHGNLLKQVIKSRSKPLQNHETN